MRFDHAAVPLAPRTTLNCIDLAFVFLRAHFAALACLWAIVAAPACGLTYALAHWYDATLAAAMLAFFIATSPLGILVIGGSAPAAFGEPFAARSALNRLGRHGIGLILMGLFWRAMIALGTLLGIVPGWYIAVRTGFSAEKQVLSHLAGHLHDRRTSELLKGEIGDLCVRSLGIIVFCGLLWLVLLATIDFAASTLLGLPILWGRMNIDVSYLGGFMEVPAYIADFLWSDPLVITTALAAALMAYVPGRLAWFFCYIDVRVRRDCWDMELAILREAERLEAA